jgi:hypothetical protein
MSDSAASDPNGYHHQDPKVHRHGAVPPLSPMDDPRGQMPPNFLGELVHLRSCDWTICLQDDHEV